MVKVRRRLRWLRRGWGRRVRLLPAGVSVLLLGVLAVVAVQSRAWGPAPGAGASPEVYTVEPGDTLAQIANRFGTSVQSLAEINQIPSADLIFPGQQLKVATESTAGAAANVERSHVVVEGETLWSIAMAYGVDLMALVERNALPDGDLLQVGQQLVIPSPDARGSGGSRSGERDDNPGGRIWVPFRTQLDGSPAAGSNCGPAALGMAMSYFGEWWTTAGIRRSVNEYQGTWSVDAGTTWEAMAYAARKRGFRVVGLYDETGNYRRWSVADLVEQTKAGRPVILLTRYWSLPEHGNSEWWGDHYIVFVGLTPTGDVVYHDSAFPDEASGAYRIMSQDRLERAWTRTATGLRYTAMALDWPGS